MYIIARFTKIQPHRKYYGNQDPRSGERKDASMSRKLIEHPRNNKNTLITKGCFIKATGDGTSNGENNFGGVQTIGLVGKMGKGK